MNKQECQAALDAIVGLPSTLIDGNREAALEYYSPTGAMLFELYISGFGEDWEFGGASSALPGLWESLCRATRVAPKEKKPK